MPQQVHDLGPHADVEGGNGLIEQQQFGAKGESPGDIDPLALAPGKFVGIAGQGRLVQTDLGQQLPRIFGWAARAIVAMNAEGFGDDLGDRHARVQGREGILEHGLHPPAQGAQPALEAPQMTSWPSKETVPEEGGMRPRIMRATVLLPEPDSPTSPRVSPRAMEKETRSTTHFSWLAPRHPAAPRIVLGELVYLEQSHGRMVEQWRGAVAALTSENA